MKRQFAHIRPSGDVSPSAQSGLEQTEAEEYSQEGPVQGASQWQGPPFPADGSKESALNLQPGTMQPPQSWNNQNNHPGTALPPADRRPITDPLNAPGQSQQNIPPYSSTPFASLHGGPVGAGQRAIPAFGSGLPYIPPFNASQSGIAPQSPVSRPTNDVPQPSMPPTHRTQNPSAPTSSSTNWSMNGVSQPPAQAPQSPQALSMPGLAQPSGMNAAGPLAMPMSNAAVMAPPQPSRNPSPSLPGAPAGYRSMPTSPSGTDYFVNPAPPAQQRNTGQLYGPPPMPAMPAELNNRPRQMMPPPGKKRHVPIWARVALAALVALIVLSGAGFWYYQNNYANFVGTSTGQAAIHHQIKDDGNTTAQVSQGAAGNGASLSGGRINILLLGSDTDGKYNDSNGILKGTPLAQTDIIITIDPQGKQVGMLSIPRDLQVTQSDTGGQYKLDEVFMHGVRGNSIGERVGNAAGLVEDTILYNFGIHIDYYAWVSLQGFVKVIDTAGGVDIDAIHPMVDDSYPFDIGNNTGDAYAYERLYIPPGPQHMTGPQALTYVRTRHSDLVGDFGRSARQQQILSDLKTKLATPGIVGELPQLIKDLNGAVTTDMQLDKILELANFARTIDLPKIQRVTLGPPFSHASQYGTNSNYYPDCAAIRTQIAQMFALGDKAGCIPQTDAPHAALIAPPTTPQRAMPAATASMPRSEGPFVNQAAVHDDMSILAPANGLNAYQGLNPVAGVHSILDLVFAVTFESFDGLQV